MRGGKLITILGLTLLIFFLLLRPEQSADFFAMLGGGIIDAWNGFERFIRALAG